MLTSVATPWHAVRRWALVSRALLFLAAAGCRDGLTAVARAPQAIADDQVLVRMVASPDTADSSFVLRASFTAGLSAGTIGGFRARLVLPSTLHVVGDPAVQTDVSTGLTRLVHLDGREVLIAGVSPDGASKGDLFRIVLHGAPAALQLVRLELDELVDVRGADRRARTVVLERPDVQGGVR